MDPSISRSIHPFIHPSSIIILSGRQLTLLLTFSEPPACRQDGWRREPPWSLHPQPFTSPPGAVQFSAQHRHQLAFNFINRTRNQETAGWLDEMLLLAELRLEQKKDEVVLAEDLDV